MNKGEKMVFSVEKASFSRLSPFRHRKSKGKVDGKVGPFRVLFPNLNSLFSRPNKSWKISYFARPFLTPFRRGKCFHRRREGSLSHFFAVLCHYAHILVSFLVVLVLGGWPLDAHLHTVASGGQRQHR